MAKMFLLAHSNLRKTKGQMAAIIVLLLLASLMLNLWPVSYTHLTLPTIGGEC